MSKKKVKKKMGSFNVSNLKLQERRDGKRFHQTGLMPGKIYTAEGEKPLSCRPVDVSKNGMGILVSERLNEGDIIIMELGDQRLVHLKIVWKKVDFGKQDLMRYGLQTEDPEVDLVQIFKKAGMLKEL